MHLFATSQHALLCVDVLLKIPIKNMKVCGFKVTEWEHFKGC